MGVDKRKYPALVKRAFGLGRKLSKRHPMISLPIFIAARVDHQISVRHKIVRLQMSLARVHSGDLIGYNARRLDDIVVVT